MRATAFRPFTELLRDLDRDLVKGAFAGEHFQEYFFAEATDDEVIAAVKEILA